MRPIHPECTASHTAVPESDQLNENALIGMYAIALAHAERALGIVERMIALVRNESECDVESNELRDCCVQIAQADARIHAARQTLTLSSRDSGARILAEAERHMKALSRLCERIREAEQAVTMRLETISPSLDAAIRGRQMVSAYRRRA